MYQVAIGWPWGSTPPWSAFWPWHLLDQLKPFWGSKHVLFHLVLAQRHFTRHTWQSMFSFSLLLQKDIWLGLLDKHVLFFKLAFYPVCLTKHVVFQLILQNGISPGILDKACSLLACFCKTALHQAYLTKMTACSLLACFWKRHFPRHTWPSMFSFYISPGRLDKACSLSACFCTTAFHQAYLTKFDKACSLSACFCKTAFHQAYLTKHVLFQLVFAKRHFARHTWQSMFSFSLLLQKDIWLGLLDKHVLFCKLAFYPVCLTKHVVFQLILQNGISPGILDKACSLLACFGKTALHQAYLTTMTKHVLF